MNPFFANPPGVMFLFPFSLSIHHAIVRSYPAARNRGLEIAKSDCIAFLDADDIWPDHRLEKLLAHMRKNPSSEIVLGYLQYVVDAHELPGNADRVELSKPHLAYSLSAALFRHTAFERVGAFDETLRHADDWDWYVRAREQGIEPVIVPVLKIEHG